VPVFLEPLPRLLRPMAPRWSEQKSVDVEPSPAEPLERRWKTSCESWNSWKQTSSERLFGDSRYQTMVRERIW
jgi:hypothetical protein